SWLSKCCRKRRKPKSSETFCGCKANCSPWPAGKSTCKRSSASRRAGGGAGGTRGTATGGDVPAEGGTWPRGAAPRRSGSGGPDALAKRREPNDTSGCVDQGLVSGKSALSVPPGGTVKVRVLWLLYRAGMVSRSFVP